VASAGMRTTEAEKQSKSNVKKQRQQTEAGKGTSKLKLYTVGKS